MIDQLKFWLGAIPAAATRLFARSCSAGVSHQGFALLGRPGKIRKPASATGREMTPDRISIRSSEDHLKYTINNEEPSPPRHATNSIEVLVGSGLKVSAEHDSNVIRYVPDAGTLEHFLRFVPRA